MDNNSNLSGQSQEEEDVQDEEVSEKEKADSEQESQENPEEVTPEVETVSEKKDLLAADEIKEEAVDSKPIVEVEVAEVMEEIPTIENTDELKKNNTINNKKKIVSSKSDQKQVKPKVNNSVKQERKPVAKKTYEIKPRLVKSKPKPVSNSKNERVLINPATKFIKNNSSMFTMISNDIYSNMIKGDDNKRRKLDFNSIDLSVKLPNSTKSSDKIEFRGSSEKDDRKNSEKIKSFFERNKEKEKQLQEKKEQLIEKYEDDYNLHDNKKVSRDPEEYYKNQMEYRKKVEEKLKEKIAKEVKIEDTFNFRPTINKKSVDMVMQKRDDKTQTPYEKLYNEKIGQPKSSTPEKKVIKKSKEYVENLVNKLYTPIEKKIKVTEEGKKKFLNNRSHEIFFETVIKCIDEHLNFEELTTEEEFEKFLLASNFIGFNTFGKVDLTKFQIIERDLVSKAWEKLSVDGATKANIVLFISIFTGAFIWDIEAYDLESLKLGKEKDFNKKQEFTKEEMESINTQLNNFVFKVVGKELSNANLIKKASQIHKQFAIFYDNFSLHWKTMKEEMKKEKLRLIKEEPLERKSIISKSSSAIAEEKRKKLAEMIKNDVDITESEKANIYDEKGKLKLDELFILLERKKKK